MLRYPLTVNTWDDREHEAIRRVCTSGRFTKGPEVAAFEAEFAAHFGVRHALMVNSGSSANLLAIAALVYHPEKLLRAGDEIIVPAVSWSTTFFPPHQYGLKLLFVDVDRDTLNIDITKLEAAITPRTKAVFAVNLLGNPNDFRRIRAICERYGLLLIEDNCEAMGARFEGRNAGTFGICGTFSTFFSHHISTMEGGVVVTEDTVLFRTMLSLRAHGWTREQPPDSHLALTGDPFCNLFRFVLPGYNLRPLEMSGAVGREQLKKLPAFVAERRRNAILCKEILGGIDGIRLQREVGESSWFGFSLLLEGRLAGRRRELVEALRANGIECRPIVAGNFLRNPVIRFIDHTVSGSVDVADDIDNNGLFIGNHHYDLAEQLEYCRRVLDHFVVGLDF